MCWCSFICWGLGRKPWLTRTMSICCRKRSMDSGVFAPSCTQCGAHCPCSGKSFLKGVKIQGPFQEWTLTVFSWKSAPARKAAFITCLSAAVDDGFTLDTADSSLLHHLLLTWTTAFLHRGPARPLPPPTEHAAHAPACWSLVAGQSRTPVTSYAGNVVYALWGLHPQPKWRSVSTSVDSTAAHRLARWEGCGPPSNFPAGVALTEPLRRRNRQAVLLAVHCVTEDQPHLTA